MTKVCLFLSPPYKIITDQECISYRFCLRWVLLENYFNRSPPLADWSPQVLPAKRQISKSTAEKPSKPKDILKAIKSWVRTILNSTHLVNFTCHLLIQATTCFRLAVVGLSIWFVRAVVAWSASWRSIPHPSHPDFRHRASARQATSSFRSWECVCHWWGSRCLHKWKHPKRTVEQIQSKSHQQQQSSKIVS